MLHVREPNSSPSMGQNFGMVVVSIQFPSQWVVLGLLGLVVDFIGATLLAASTTEYFKNLIRGKIETEFTKRAKDSRDTLRNEGKSAESDPGFEYLNDVVSPYVGGEIRSYEWIETEVPLGDEIEFELESGETGKLTQIQVSNAIERFEQEMTDNLRMRASLLSGLILAFGFLMQIGSYVARYFIA